MAEETITGALGLKDEWFNDKVKSVSKNWDAYEKVSDVILNEAEIERTESFGEVGVKLSEYEVKLVTLGYIIGLRRNEPMIKGGLEADDFVKFLIEMMKRKGE